MLISFHQLACISGGMCLSVFAIVIALLLDFALGDPAWRWHPVRVLGGVAETLEIVCRRIHASVRVQGTVFLLLNIAIFIFSLSLILLTVSFSKPLSILVDGVMIYFALGGTCLAREVSKVAASLIEDGPEAARGSLRMLVSRDVDGMGAEEISSSAIETLAENFSDSACATLFYAAIGGTVFAWVHRIANTLDAMVGYKTKEYAEFGWASARFDDLMNYLPARISAVIIAIVSAAVQGSVGMTLERARLDGGALPSPNSGYPIAAFAGALGVRLCGPVSYFGKMKEKPFIGIGPTPCGADIMRAQSLYWNAYAFAAAASLALGQAMLS
jgi:adenosylcobinamide-phosphate synthase